MSHDEQLSERTTTRTTVSRQTRILVLRMGGSGSMVKRHGVRYSNQPLSSFETTLVGRMRWCGILVVSCAIDNFISLETPETDLVHDPEKQEGNGRLLGR